MVIFSEIFAEIPQLRESISSTFFHLFIRIKKAISTWSGESKFRPNERVLQLPRTPHSAEKLRCGITRQHLAHSHIWWWIKNNSTGSSLYFPIIICRKTVLNTALTKGQNRSKRRGKHHQVEKAIPRLTHLRKWATGNNVFFSLPFFPFLLMSFLH